MGCFTDGIAVHAAYLASRAQLQSRWERMGLPMMIKAQPRKPRYRVAAWRSPHVLINLGREKFWFPIFQNQKPYSVVWAAPEPRRIA